ncbi:MAG: 2OG-Fe(II) oxygenase [Gammaproteobacteria bacterium]|nr:2OG-Fe(II) oxygenase [Gammaproteobacteria bacterium]MDH3464931.1 2OG-Fe(II) oxygenase [Gammaproteobacteria bacterium]
MLSQIVDLTNHPLQDESFRRACNRTLREEGVLVLHNFLQKAAVDSVRREGQDNQHLAFYTANHHNIYLAPPDPEFPTDHPRNREVISSKGCITTNQIPDDSAVSILYNAPEFREFLCVVLNEKELYEYADGLSSINLHYADAGQELGWHFDNSSFAITLMIQNPESGGEFEYVRDVRDADAGEMNYDLTGRILDGDVAVNRLSMNAGALVLFRGRNSMHRVTPVEGERTRILVVLAYNSAPGISLSESARMTFYGRL